MSELLDKLLRAAMSGDWYLLVATALVAAIWLTRKYLSPKWGFLRTDAGGVLLAFAFAFFGAVATALGAGAPLGAPLFLAALKIGFTSMGGYAALRKLLWPLLKTLPLPGKWGAPSAAAEAGVKAVQEKPGPGAGGVAGEPKDIP